LPTFGTLLNDVAALASVVALAASELLARISRHLTVEVEIADAGGTTVWVPAHDWPDLRMRPVEASYGWARPRNPDLSPAGDLLSVRLDLTGAAPPRAGARSERACVRLDCAITGDRLKVDFSCTRGDPCERAGTPIAEAFAELLRSLITNPFLPPALAEGIGEASRRLVLGELAGGAVDNGPFLAIPEMIERRTDMAPDRPALTYEGRTLSYIDLDRVANGLAADLAARGIAKGDVVPVVLANSLELPVSYLALMKLGAAFVPFDPGWPAARLRAALDVLAPKLAICADAASLPEDSRHLALTVDVSRIAGTDRRPAVPLGPEDVIYGIFTSGTTGTPKCAMNMHGGLTNRFLFMTRYFGADESEVVLQNSKHTFDSSVWQMFWPLTIGGHAVIPAQGEFLDLDRTIETISTYGITMTDFVPTIFNVMVSLVERSEEARRKVASLRRLIVGGEEITPHTVHKLCSMLPGVRITNGYGPTEASIGMIFHTVSPADGDAIPLGRPIDNCYVLILSEDLHLLPPGVPGEIVIGGACLGSGYFRDPDRTAEAFIANPFPEIPGDRLYRTGDLGLFDAGGMVRFLGRRDFQVKIGGVRVELGEIETVALACPHVRQAKVLVAQQQTRKSLALFAVGDSDLDEECLREHMRRTLPRTSLPRLYFVLPDMPVTDHGKVDHRRLRALLDLRLAEDAARLESLGTVTMALGRVLQVFRSVLEKPDLLPDEDFMAAGGDSLQALSAVMELSSAFDLRLGVQDLLTNRTADAMSRLIERRRAGDVCEHEDDAELMERDAAAPITAAGPHRSSREPLSTVLLTGATGFVGSRVLYELLTRTTLRVVCLCRAETDRKANRRLVDTLMRQNLWEDAFVERVEVLAGNLEVAGLGLDPAVRDRLARDCDAILHAGAMVNFLFDYRTHRAANVLGTQDLLRLAQEGKPKALHHISTLGTLDCEAVRHASPLPEDFDVATAVAPNSGYSRSKWVAERSLVEARALGADVTIHRLGEVMPATDNGQPNGQALTHFLLAAFHRLGIHPAASLRSDFSPVDYVAQRIVAALSDPLVQGRTLHVFHPESVCFTQVLTKAGIPTERVSCTEFLSRLQRECEETGERELVTLRSLLPSHAGHTEDDLRRIFEGLLVDNPRLFRKDACCDLERRHGLPELDTAGAMRAYRSHLDARDGIAGLLAVNH
jgi:amino acid adenylation domain-containing protein/thioester reductase-like protein